MSVNDKMIPITVDGAMFKRKDAWFGLFQRGGLYGNVDLFLGTLHGIACRAPERLRLINIFVTYEGERVPFTASAVSCEYTLHTEYGDIRFTFADDHKLMAEGDKGMGLEFEKEMARHEFLHPRKDGAWECAFRYTASFIFKGLEGSTFDFNNGENSWDWRRLSNDHIIGRTHPAPDGTFTLVMEEFDYCGYVRDSYPTYAEAKESMQADWEKFLASTTVPFNNKYESHRADADYILWSFMTGKSGAAQHPIVQMFAGIIGSTWQCVQNAVALQEDMDLAAQLLLGPLAHANDVGQLPDMFDDHTSENEILKPPVHGWAILEIMKHHDLHEWSDEVLEEMYYGMGRWGDWFLNYRDDDGDGLPSLMHPDETGLDFCTVFRYNSEMVSPDLIAYLVLLFEAEAKLAEALGKDAGEIAGWNAKRQQMLDGLTEKMWDGEHFCALVPYTHERYYSNSIVHYIPLVLGARLPKEMIDKMVEELLDTTTFNSPYGLALEKMTSKDFSPEFHTIGKGGIVPPPMIYICTGLSETHRRDALEQLATTYLDTLIDKRFAFTIDPRSGATSPFFGGSWPRVGYLIISRALDA